MNKTIKIPANLAVTYHPRKCHYHVCGGDFDFYLYLCGDGDVKNDCYQSGDHKLWIDIPLNGKKWLSCDVVETLVVRELHKLFA